MRIHRLLPTHAGWLLSAVSCLSVCQNDFLGLIKQRQLDIVSASPIYRILWVHLYILGLISLIFQVDLV